MKAWGVSDDLKIRSLMVQRYEHGAAYEALYVRVELRWLRR